MKRSVLIAGFILLGLGVYFLIGTLSKRADDRKADAAPVAAEQSAVIPDVVTLTARAQPHDMTITLKGRTEPDRIVTVKSGTTGTVIAAPAREGAYVNTGAVLCRLDVESRQARLSEAEAQLAAQQLDYNAAQTLADKGLTPKTRAAALEAAVDAAQAAVNAARVELRKTTITAPFPGIFEQRLAETGDFLGPGGACGVLLDMSPIIAVAEITEEQASRLTRGSDVSVIMPGGVTETGKLRFIASTADARTRTYRIEAAVQNPGNKYRSGVTASVSVPAGKVEAIKLTPALLTLADTGAVGVRYVSDDNTVVFAPVKTVDQAEDGIWVTGLPSPVRLLAPGQDFVKAGIKVNPIETQAAIQ